MDKSGPRHIAALKSPLIERSDLQSPHQRTLYGALTLGFWAFWIYLWVPILALLAWLLGFEQAYKYMIVFGGYRDLLRLLGIYALIIVMLGGTLVVWALYNIVRFRGVEKRKAPRAVTPTEIGTHFVKDPLSVARWQGHQRLYVMHDENGNIATVKALVDGAPVPL